MSKNRKVSAPTKHSKKQYTTKSKHPSFIRTEEGNDLIARAKRYLNGGYPVHFTGASGTGKTALAMQVAAELNQPATIIHGNHEMNNVDLIGGTTGWSSSKTIDNFVRQVYKQDANVKENWTPGRLTEAVQHGHVLIYDEFSRSTPETNNLFLSVLEEKLLPLYGTKQKQPSVAVHPNFKLILTSNPTEYAGVFQTQDALADRLITLEINLSQQTKETILRKSENLSEQESNTVWQLIEQIEHETDDESVGLGLRAAFMIARIAKNSKASFSSEDSIFRQTCSDVLSSYLVRSGRSGTIQEAQNLIREILQDSH